MTCSHVRQYFRPGERMPCAVPTCRDGIAGECMVSVERTGVSWGRVNVKWEREPIDNSWAWRRMSIAEAAHPLNRYFA